MEKELAVDVAIDKQKNRKGFLPIAHMLIGLVLSLMFLFGILTFLGILNEEDKVAIDSTKAITYAASCAASSDGNVDVRYQNFIGDEKWLSNDLQGVLNPPCEIGATGEDSPGDCFCGQDRTFEVSKTKVSCTETSGVYKCNVINFDLPQEVSDPEKWIAGWGDPRYVIYHNTFPEGEEAGAVWKTLAP